MVKTIKAGVAALKTLESWGVTHVYGIPGGTFNNMMYALDEEKDNLKYIHVRHEEVGALAAVADGKLTGHIGVAFGSAGPGATHLFQGAYDAKMDKVPTLFLVGQVEQRFMNYDFFQELDEDPMFQDAALYARTVTTAASLPHIIDEAIRRAYAGRGAAIVVIPNDLAAEEIPADGYYSAAATHATPVLPAGSDEQVDAALRVADLIMFVGSNYPFAEVMFSPNAKFIQIEADPKTLGKRHHTDVAILADAPATLKKMIDRSDDAPRSGWYQANVDNVKNWHQYNNDMMTRTTGKMRFEPVFGQINRIATDDAIFAIDVGDVTQNAVRLLKVNGRQAWTTSGLFATMGAGLPAALAGQLSFPKRQVFNLAGDGAAAMVMQDLDTEVRYHLPIINVIFSNNALGYIEDEQEDDGHEWFGIDMPAIDFATVAKGMGMTGITVTQVDELTAAIETAEANRAAGKPTLIDAKITNERPIPVEHLQLDPNQFDADTIAAFKKRYYAERLVPLSEFLKTHKVPVA
ncbi:thiamine pyrophosphate-dependent enzyme [Lacticaseibacillus paracasei]|uniref:thiamine pyrophosphate-dependent enzyme n=1 Tax=Lacticaseibacillus paracasei TaxID=1597 RepID=UPI0021C29DCE|nr:thiamine pyrophosphate-dependent enzyme [Lacticaseibacillus paracasei]MCP9309951.1 pyruvate oxidase [Lacticaseibacillus paracasei]MCP9346702.1 pyruvate oxidase [Lacticaseibacillus paracasei]MCP9366298.1 pyruvate oxidase [Lacticaseibacillus paracasei]MCP9378670.1 pyruvate oxidase [Lacticaseibacillus paracasei]